MISARKSGELATGGRYPGMGDYFKKNETKTKLKGKGVFTLDMVLSQVKSEASRLFRLE